MKSIILEKTVLANGGKSLYDILSVVDSRHGWVVTVGDGTGKKL